MKPFRLRQLTLLLLAFAVAAGSLLIAASALADKAAFRVERRWNNDPRPPVTPGGAGRGESWVQPYLTMSRKGEDYYYTAPNASVEPGNPVGAPFTLPSGFIDFIGTWSATPRTGWAGYSTYSEYDYYNGPGTFKPNNVHTDTIPKRIVFPTTQGNPTTGCVKAPNCNYGTGNPTPNAVTTTFDGRYDFSKAGSINVTPGPNKFGGTWNIFYRENAYFYQFISAFAPTFFKGYADFTCYRNGVLCYPGQAENPGDLTAIYRAERYVLNVAGTGTGTRPPYTHSNNAKATTDRTAYGSFPTPNTSGTRSFLVQINQYLGIIHPWTTGFVSVMNPAGIQSPIFTPQYQGYDTDLFGTPKITVTYHDYNANWNSKLDPPRLTYTTYTYKQYMYDVDRVVSMVRPRLVHTYQKPLDPSVTPLKVNWSTNTEALLRVFFVPEPTGTLLLGAGIAALLGLSRMRRR